MKRNYIFEARKLANKTQGEVAESLGINQSTYSNKERALDFTNVEMIKLIDILGEHNIENAKESAIKMQEPKGNYDTKYNLLLSEVNKLLQLQRAGMLIQAEIISRIDGLPADQALDELKKLYEEKTGQKVDI